ncbi:MAG: metallophosphoesterase family protein [Bilophila wadsworthia]
MPAVVADHLKTLVQKPDALVITGDLADSGDAHAHSLLHEALAPLSCRCTPCPATMTAATGCANCSGIGAPPMLPWLHLCYAVEDGPVRLVMLDTMQPGSHSGHCPEAVAGWLGDARPGPASRPCCSCTIPRS